MPRRRLVQFACAVCVASLLLACGKRGDLEFPADRSMGSLYEAGGGYIGPAQGKIEYDGESGIRLFIQREMSYDLSPLDRIRSGIIVGIFFPGGLEDETQLEHVTDLGALKHLEVSWTALSEKSAKEMGGLKELEWLDLSGSEIPAALGPSLRQLTALRHLNLRKAKFDEGFLESVAALTGLQSLNLRDTEIGDDGLAHISGLVHLTRLDLRGTRVTAAGMKHLRNMTDLDEFKVDFPIRNEDIPSLRGLGALEKLVTTWLLQAVRNHTIDAGALPYLKELDYLKRLRLGGLQLKGESLEPLGEMTWLEELEIDRTGLNDEDLAPIAKLVNLRRLEVQGNLALGDPALEHIGKLTNLRSLNLRYTLVTDQGMEWLQNLRSLEELDLSHTAITDRGLERLQDLGSLQELDLGYTAITDLGVSHLSKLSRLRRIDLSQTAVTDLCVKSLQALPELESLSFIINRTSTAPYKTQITDVGALLLGNIRTLKRLQLPGATVSQAAVDALRERLPDCEIILFNPPPAARRVRSTGAGPIS